MAEEQAKPVGPDLAQGIAVAELADGGKLAGCEPACNFDPLPGVIGAQF